MVKNLPAILETLVWSLGKEYLLQKGMASHASILAWRISWTEEFANYVTVNFYQETRVSNFSLPCPSVLCYLLINLPSPNQFCTLKPSEPMISLLTPVFGVMYRLWELNYEESWAPKNWCFLIVVLEKTLESPLDCKEIQTVHPKGDQSWVFTGRTDVEAETPILWPPDAKSWLIWKDPDAGKDWGQEEKGTTV